MSSEKNSTISILSNEKSNINKFSIFPSEKKLGLLHKKSLKMINPENVVCVRVWLSGPFDGRRVGHASLQTKNIYASFSPNSNTSSYDKLTRKGAKAHFSTLESDTGLTNDLKEEISKGCKPDVEINLYSLDVDKINKAFFKFKEKNYLWSAWGSDKESFTDKNSQIRNCSGLVADLLVAGGIKNLFFGSEYGSNYPFDKIPNPIISKMLSMQSCRLEIRSSTRVINSIQAPQDIAAYAALLFVNEDHANLIITPDGVAKVIQQAKEIENSFMKTKEELEEISLITSKVNLNM